MGVMMRWAYFSTSPKPQPRMRLEIYSQYILIINKNRPMYMTLLYATNLYGVI